MHRRLALALLLAFLLEPAAAVSPAMDAMLPVAHMASCYPDPDGILTGICELCVISGLEYCVHAMTDHHVPQFTAESFLNHPEWPSVLDPSPEPECIPPQPQLPPALYYGNGYHLDQGVVEQLDSNATSMLRSTIELHVDITYLPGDRLAAQAEQRRHPQKRQAPRRAGFPCSTDGCRKAFDRMCDLNRHLKTHLGKSERPHKCSFCSEKFLYPKDRARHERTHEQSSSLQAILYCRAPGCANVDGFSRRDNLLRHQRKQHPRLIVSA